MKKRFYHISLLAVIAALVFSTMGVTTIAVSCRMRGNMESGCPKCKHVSDSPTKKESCCKTTVKHIVLKADFEKLGDRSTDLSLQATIPVLVLNANLLVDPSFNSTILGDDHLTLSRMASVDTYALLATFRI
ncbi:MAG: hypothetical protein Q8916_13370 [Bacteroidota bacterium]|nr:hypothetical protein [Bacteroidota bacterium]MDP4237451.1 hypothetical protein [Bacteroidota bacterium]